MSRFWLLLPLALAACSQPRTPLPTGPAQAPPPPEAPVVTSILTPERVAVEGAAGWEMAPLAEVLQRSAVTESDVARVEAILSSGAAFDSAVPIARLTRPNVTEGLYQAGTAYLLDAFPGTSSPQVFRLAVTAELTGGGESSVGLSIEVRDPDGTTSGGVGQLLVTLMDPGVNTTAQLSVSTRGPTPGDVFEIVASEPLAARDWRGTHRIELDYEPGRLFVSLDGLLVVTAPVRLDRPAGPVYIGAFASTPTMGVTLLDLSFDSP